MCLFHSFIYPSGLLHAPKFTVILEINVLHINLHVLLHFLDEILITEVDM